MNFVDPSSFLNESGRNVYREDYVPLPKSEWPEAWKTTFYKEYGRYPAVPLQKTANESRLQELIATRKSRRTFSSEHISFTDLSTLLKYSCGEFEYKTPQATTIHRAQPSGGARYPIEAYVVLRGLKGDELELGVHHYNVKTNSLEFLWSEQEQFLPLTAQELPEHTSALICFTGVMWRSQMKYGLRAQRLAYVEVGAIIENMYLLANELGVGCVAYSGTNDDKVESQLGLASSHESLMMSVVIGKKQ